jgi:ribonuclease J
MRRRPPVQFRKTGKSALKTTVKIPDVEPGVIRVIPLGGVEEVGRNMTVIEGPHDIIIVDCGLQFKYEETPGIDFIIPNTRYLEERKHKIRGMFITHGHLDHIGAIPYTMGKIGNPPIYSRQFGAVMITKRQDEFPREAKLKINVLDGGETVRFTDFAVETFPISHTIPDSMGLVIQTKLGPIAFIEDVRVDNVAGKPTEEEVKQYERFKNQDFLMLTMDSTSIEKPGFSVAESTVVENLERFIKDATGRLIIGAFASQIERVINIIDLTEKYGKKVAVYGRSMENNVEISKQLKLIKAKNLIPIDEINNHPANKIVIVATGSQGEEYSALWRMGHKADKNVTLSPTDTVLLSSSIIPGNEYVISKLKDNLYRQEAKIITYRDSDIHASGHGNRGELEWIHRQIKYRFFMPVHGHHFMLRQHAELAVANGLPKENTIIPDNGSIIEFYESGHKWRRLKEKAPNELTLVDGFSVGDFQNVVLRDRQLLAADGIFVVIAVVDARNGKVRKSPDIISRGFVYLKESQELIQETRQIAKRTVEDGSKGMHPIDFEFIKKTLADNLGRFLFQKTAKRPLVIPVILSV